MCLLVFVLGYLYLWLGVWRGGWFVCLCWWLRLFCVVVLFDCLWVVCGYVCLRVVCALFCFDLACGIWFGVYGLGNGSGLVYFVCLFV